MNGRLILRAEQGGGFVVLVPEDAGRLARAGLSVCVEVCPSRLFPASAYARAGCDIVPAGSWRRAPLDAFVLGTRPPEGEPEPLAHRHLFFAADPPRPLLRRFLRGGGLLLDLGTLVRAPAPDRPATPELCAALSAELVPHLLGLVEGTPVWMRAERIFWKRAAVERRHGPVGRWT